MKKTDDRLHLKKMKISKLTNLAIIIGGGQATEDDTTDTTASPTTHTTLGQLSDKRNACAVGNGGS